MIDDDRIVKKLNLRPEDIEHKKVRFRTLGCYPQTGAVESEADIAGCTVEETLALSNRSARAVSSITREPAAWNAGNGRVISDMNDLLKFITCGKVDDGKSTLIGHLLYDAKLIYADQKEALLLDPKVGSRGGAIDYSLLLDGLLPRRA